MVEKEIHVGMPPPNCKMPPKFLFLEPSIKCLLQILGIHEFQNSKQRKKHNQSMLNSFQENAAPELFPGKVAAPVSSLKIKFKEKIQDLFCAEGWKILVI